MTDDKVISLATPTISTVWGRMTYAERMACIRTLKADELFSVLVRGAEELTNRQYKGHIYADQRSQVLGDFITHLRRVFSTMGVNITPSVSALMRTSQWERSFFNQGKLVALCNATASSVTMAGLTFMVSTALAKVPNINYVEFVANALGSIDEERVTYRPGNLSQLNGNPASEIVMDVSQYDKPGVGKAHQTYVPVFSTDPETNKSFIALDTALTDVMALSKKEV